MGTLDGRRRRNALAPWPRAACAAGAYALELQATDPSGLQRTRSTRLRVIRQRDARYSGWRMTGRLAAPASSRRRTGVV